MSKKQPDRKHVGRGFDKFRRQVEDRGNQRYIASCQSCRFFEEACTNNNVTKFDVVTTDEGRTYCAYWQGFQPSTRKNKKSEYDW